MARRSLLLFILSALLTFKWAECASMAARTGGEGDPPSIAPSSAGPDPRAVGDGYDDDEATVEDDHDEGEGVSPTLAEDPTLGLERSRGDGWTDETHAPFHQAVKRMRGPSPAALPLLDAQASALAAANGPDRRMGRKRSCPCALDPSEKEALAEIARAAELMDSDRYLKPRFTADDLGNGPSEQGQRRQRRSADYQKYPSNYWYNMGDADRYLMKMDPVYAVKNRLSAQMESIMPPLHYGKIFEGNIGNPASYDPSERVFGVDADFNLPREMDQFKYRPSGPRLNLQDWQAGAFPVYSHSLYHFLGTVSGGVQLTPSPKFNVVVPAGIYRMKVITSDDSLVMKNLKTHITYKFPPNFLKNPEEIVKLKALAPWVDPNGRYWKHEGAFFIRGTPQEFGNPMFGNHLVYDGLPSGPTVTGTLIPPEGALSSPEGIDLS